MTRKAYYKREQTVITNMNMYIYYYVLYQMYLNRPDMEYITSPKWIKTPV